MKLVTEPCMPADLEAAKSVYGPEKGDLASALVTSCYPIAPGSDLAKYRERAEWSLQQQKDLLENDPTTRFVKVVDADSDNEIVAVGRWHKYPQGGYQRNGDLEIAGLKDRNDPATFPEGMISSFYLSFSDAFLGKRQELFGTDPQWVLTNIVTREPLRKHGAGSMMLEWGLKQAAADGVPCFLESIAEAKGLYEKHGFRETKRHDVDCADYGMPGVKLVISTMRADPK